MTRQNLSLSRRARKTRFLHALKSAGLNVERWAAQQGVSRGHCYEVLNGNRISAPLTEKMDALIAAHQKEAA